MNLQHKTLNQLTHTEYAALKAYAQNNGRTWKQKLSDLWATGCDNQELQSIRNKIGTRGLYSLSKTSINARV